MTVGSATTSRAPLASTSLPTTTAYAPTVTPSGVPRTGYQTVPASQGGADTFAATATTSSAPSTSSSSSSPTGSSSGSGGAEQKKQTPWEYACQCFVNFMKELAEKAQAELEKIRKKYETPAV